MNLTTGRPKSNLNTKRVVIGIIALCVVGLASDSIIRYPQTMPHNLDQNSSDIENGLENGKPLRAAPGFTLSDSEGHKHTLLDFKGNYVILHFWATWCPPCLSELPNWVELGNEFKNSRVKLVAISLDQKWDDAQRILPSRKLSSQIISLLDPSGSVADLYGSFQFPETYLIDPVQKIVTKWVGPQDWTGEEFKAKLRSWIQ